MIRDFGGWLLGKRQEEAEEEEVQEVKKIPDLEIQEQSLRNQIIQKKIPPPSKPLSKPKHQGDFILREKSELSLDEFHKTPWIDIGIHELESFDKYLEPLQFKRPSKLTASADRQPSNLKFATRVDSGQLNGNANGSHVADQRDDPRSQIFHEEVTVANFNKTISKKLAYLKQAYHFLKFYYKDCAKADLNQLALRSGIDKEVLQLWIENRHAIVHILTILAKNQV